MCNILETAEDHNIISEKKEEEKNSVSCLPPKILGTTSVGEPNF